MPLQEAAFPAVVRLFSPCMSGAHDGWIEKTATCYRLRTPIRKLRNELVSPLNIGIPRESCGEGRLQRHGGREDREGDFGLRFVVGAGVCHPTSRWQWSNVGAKFIAVVDRSASREPQLDGHEGALNIASMAERTPTPAGVGIRYRSRYAVRQLLGL